MLFWRVTHLPSKIAFPNYVGWCSEIVPQYKWDYSRIPSLFMLFPKFICSSSKSSLKTLLLFTLVGLQADLKFKYISPKGISEERGGGGITYTVLSGIADVRSELFLKLLALRYSTTRIAMGNEGISVVAPSFIAFFNRPSHVQFIHARHQALTKGTS